MRPRERLLDVDRIVAAAFELGDRKGSFTVSELAERLKVHPSSLYHHVRGRTEVIDLMRAAMALEIDTSAFGTRPWDEAIETMAWSYRAVFARHAGSIRMLATSQVSDERSLLAYEEIAASLLGAGFDRRDVLPVIVAIDNFVLGSAMDSTNASELYSPDPGAHPSLHAALHAAHSPDAAQSVSTRAFALGLDALLHGLRHRLHLTAC